jgi:hypothetical protein
MLNSYVSFSDGVIDAIVDTKNGPIMAGGPTEKLVTPTLDYIVSEFRSRLACSDEYLAGYLSITFKRI